MCEECSASAPTRLPPLDPEIRDSIRNRLRLCLICRTLKQGFRPFHNAHPEPYERVHARHRLLARYNAGGPQALGDLRRRNGTSPSVLRPDLLEKLKARLREPPPDGGLWTSPKVAAWMAGELGRAAVLPQRGWEALKAIHGSVQKPRPRHPAAATPEQREAFKKSWSRPSLRREPSTRTRRSKSGPRTNTASG